MGLDDLYTEMEELFNKHWKIEPGSPDLFRAGSLDDGRPPKLPDPRELTDHPGQQEQLKFVSVYMNYFLATLSNLILTKFSEAFKITPAVVDFPDWISPPYHAENVDAINPTKLTIPAAGSKRMMKIYVHKGCMTVIQGVGQALESSQAWDDVSWDMKFNGVFPTSCCEWGDENYVYPTYTLQKKEQYRGFRAMLGPLYDPYRFPKPYVITEHQTFEINASNTGGIDHYGMVRVIGYTFRPKHTAAMGKGYSE